MAESQELLLQHKQQLDTRLYGRITTAEQYQYWVIAGAYLFLAFVYAAGLFVYVKKNGKVWLFRRVQRPQGVYIASNGFLLWILLWTVFACLRFSGAVCNIATNVYRSPPHWLNNTTLTDASLLLLLIAGWLSVCNNILVVSLAYANRVGSKRRFLLGPRLMNCLTFVVGAILVTGNVAINILLDIQSAHAISATNQALASLDQSLDPSSQELQQSQAIRLAQMAEEMHKRYWKTRSIFITMEFAIALFAMTFYFPFLLAFIHRLRKSINDMKSFTAASAPQIGSQQTIQAARDSQYLASIHRPSAKPAAKRSNPFSALPGANPTAKYHFLILYTIAFVVYVAGLIGMGIYLVHDPAANGTPKAVLADAYVEITMGGIVGAAVLFLAFRPDVSAPKSSDGRKTSEEEWRSHRRASSVGMGGGLASPPIFVHLSVQTTIIEESESKSTVSAEETGAEGLETG